MTKPALSGRPFFDRTPRFAGLWAIALGVLAAAGFAPLGLWPLALLGAGLAIHLFALTETPRQAAWLGWLFGLGHFTFSNNWIATAFTYQAEMPVFLGWVAVPLLAVYLAVYPMLAAFAARWLAGRFSPVHGAALPFVLMFAGTWVVSEWLRSWVFTGYAWNPFAMTLLGGFERPGLAALAPWMGTYALSGLAMLLAGGLALLLIERRFWHAGGVAALLAAGMFAPPFAGREGTLAVTIAQPDIRQHTLSNPAYFEANFRRLAQLSPRPDPADTSPRIVLWPESGMVDYLREGYPQRYYDRTTTLGNPLIARRRLGRTVGTGSVLLTGAVDLEIGEVDGRQTAIGARNAVTVVGADGSLLAGYAKAHLVPYGEYLPMRELLEPLGLSRLVAGSIDFWPGPGPRTLNLGAHGKAGIQICYEIIFSGQVTQAGARPDYIFNPSNEAWFDPIAQPQFFAQARLRAIEEGLPVLRATTTGISGIVDARGVVREHLGHQSRDRIDAKVPPPRAPTLFARAGNALALVWATIFLALGYVAMRRRRR